MAMLGDLPAPERKGWLCVFCNASVSPDVALCPRCASEPAPFLRQADCGCPPGGTCQSTACRRALRVVCG